MQKQNQSRPLAFGLTLLSALGRLVPHAPNVTPLGGSCLFAGSRVSGLWAYLLPLAVMVATDPLRRRLHLDFARDLRAAFCSTSGSVAACSAASRRFAWAARHFVCSLQFFVLTVFGQWAVGVAHHNAFFAPGSERV